MLNPPQQQVNVARMMIYSLIPFLAIYAGWRIQKFWVLTGITMIVVGTGLGASFYLAQETQFYGEGTAGAVITITNIAVSLLMVRYFAKRYNNEMYM